MKSQFLIEVESLTVREAGRFLLKDVSFKIKRGECWAIVGESGSGKSTLFRCISQYTSHPDRIQFNEKRSPNIAWIRHQHQFKNRSGSHQFYYQQRFNASEADDASTVSEDLTGSGIDHEKMMHYLALLQIAYLKHTPLIQLSNGEHKRFQIAKALSEDADWLLLDSPYTGLDAHARMLLDEILRKVADKGVHILIACQENLPDFVTHVGKLRDGILTGVYKRESYSRSLEVKKGLQHSHWELPDELFSNSQPDFSYAVKMKDVHVRYHDRQILNSITWQVKKGERWSLSGPNGSGKSTLLSLITGDNPQAFANDIYLFDRKRGSGETIWEIKQKIGYISPELHDHFDKTCSCFETVASGLFDTIGLFKKLNVEQEQRVNQYLEAFRLSEMASRSLHTLSHGMQRWVLLARALVKDPPLLILDEPCQDLDRELRDRFLSLVESFCGRDDKTLLYVTHVDEEVPGCIDHFLKLDNGNITEINNNGKEHHRNSGRRHRA